jgi:hypothetical protein
MAVVSILGLRTTDVSCNAKLDVPFPDIEMCSRVVSALVDAIAQIDYQILQVDERCCECSLPTQ